MLSEFAKGVLKNHRINEEDVESVDNNLVVTFKDGSQHRSVKYGLVLWVSSDSPCKIVSNRM